MKHKAFFIFMTALLIGSPLYAQKYKAIIYYFTQQNKSATAVIVVVVTNILI